MGTRSDEENNDPDRDQRSEFSDPEDYVDDVPDDELMSDLLSREPREDEGLAERCVLVENVPKVGADRFEKLKNVLFRLFTKFGQTNTFELPLEEDGTTKGSLFIEFTTSESAREAVRNMDGHRFDKTHQFATLLLSEFDRVASVNEKYVAYTPEPFQEKGDLRAWLQDSDANDQFAVMTGGSLKPRVTIYWNTRRKIEPVDARDAWSDAQIVWSPLGTYMATFHVKGLALWGGRGFSQINRFLHPRLEKIQFSPNEKFVVTMSNVKDSKENPQAVIVWETKTARVRRSFQNDSAEWPFFKWSSDDSVFAKLGTDCIYFYDTKTFNLLDLKPMRVERVRGLAWSPALNERVLAYWVAEQADVPARLVILQLDHAPPSEAHTQPGSTTPAAESFRFRELRSANLLDVIDLKLHWHRAGDYLAVIVTRYSKKKLERNQDGTESWKYLGLQHTIEIFRIREKQIPLDKVDVKEPIEAFAWEPNGSRFAFIAGQKGRTSVHLYSVNAGSAKLRTYDKSYVNRLFWSPSGQYLVLASLKELNQPIGSGALEFLDAETLNITQTGEHTGASYCEWDPTGRFFVSASLYPLQKLDNGIFIWSLVGRLLHKENLEHLAQFTWRPRPPSPLSESAVKDIKKNYRKLTTKFDLQDRMLEMEVSKELIDRRMESIRNYQKWLWRARIKYLEAQEVEQRKKLRDNDDQSSDGAGSAPIEEKFDMLVSVEEQPLDARTGH